MVLMKAVLTILFFTATLALAQPVRFFVGTYTENGMSRGIYTGTLDTQTGRLSPLELAAGMQSPNYLALSPDEKSLYAVSPTNGGSLGAFSVATNGQLAFLNMLPAGKECCHVSVGATGRNVFVVNYFADSVGSYLTKPDGSIRELAQLQTFTGSGPNAERQDRPHLHSIYADAASRYVYACDLGTDNIWFFGLHSRTGKLEALDPPSFKVPPGSGPRHLAFSPDEQYVYVNGEMGLNVNVFARTYSNGKLRLIQTIATLPPEAETEGMSTAEIICHPSGKWLYVSHRDSLHRRRDSVTVFSIGTDGRLTWLQNAPAEVRVPRGFGMDPTGQWLIMAGQTDNKLAVLKIDDATGRLSTTGQTAMVGSPVCVIFEKLSRQ
jgi:6-phosphogluconolactonase